MISARPTLTGTGPAPLIAVVAMVQVVMTMMMATAQVQHGSDRVPTMVGPRLPRNSSPSNVMKRCASD